MNECPYRASTTSILIVEEGGEFGGEAGVGDFAIDDLADEAIAPDEEGYRQIAHHVLVAEATIVIHY